LTPNRAIPIVALLLVAAGCDSATTADPTMTVKATKPTSSTATVPTIASPLTLAAVRPQPCTVLTPQQLSTLGLPSPGTPALDPIEAKLRDYCTWRLGPAQDIVEVSMPRTYETTETLAGAYEQHDAGVYAYFEETTVSGYPAAFGGITDNRAAGGCELRVGVADKLAVDITVLVTTGADPCALAASVGTEVIATVAATQ